MESQESILSTEGVNVYFVIPSKYEIEKECSDDMWLAYNKCEEFDINPEWITEQKSQKLKPQKTDVFIMEEFSGKAFESLKTSKCSIVGPRGLLCCLMNNEPIPENSNPVFVTAMRDLVICASGFSKNVKNEIQEKVEYMGGIFSSQLLGSVTHLVTDRIMSKKYEIAVEIQTIKIMTIEWIDAVWKKNQTQFIKASDSSFDRYKCPVFLNTYITATSVTRQQKAEIKNLVNANGGEYMGQLDGAKTNIVITLEEGSLTKKLTFALQKDIACLKYPWLTDSIAAGHALPFNDYLVKSSKACSTPERANATLDFSCVSVIPFENQNGIVDESMAFSTMSRINSTCTPSGVPTPITPNKEQNKEETKNFLDVITLAAVKKLGPFLDSCNIYVTGFQPKHKDKLNKIINVSSATRLDDITDDITHVLVGDVVKAKHDLKTIYTNGLRPHIVNLNWLEESLKLRHPAPEECFLVETEETFQKVPEPPSPLSKKNMEMLRRTQRPAPPLFVAHNEPEENCNEPDLLEEYSRKTIVANKSVAEIFQLTINSKEKEKKASQTLVSVTQSASLKNRSRDSESLVPLSQTETIGAKIFEGLNFLISGFQPDDYQHLQARISTLGGEVVSRAYSGIADYGVIPISGVPLKETVSEIVTDIFIDDCLYKDELVPLDYYHRPVFLQGNTKPLEGCVIAISTYIEQERQFLQQLAEILGASHQDTFARRTNLEKKTLSSTHLICPEPKGSKYDAAVKWKLPAISAAWLLKCAEKMELVDENPYLIGETMAPESRNTMIDSNFKIPTQMATPIRLAAVQQQETPGGHTPLVNKRLSAIMNKTPQSPFHVNTPETPYGAMFKDDPSPDTRKGWVKWINNFPDLREELPPPKRRAPSTPLSDLKRKMWEKLKGPLDEEDDSNMSLNKSSGMKIQEEPVFKPVELASRRLSYSDENSPLKANYLDKEMDQLDKALRASTSSADKRKSVNVEQAKTSPLEHEDINRIEKETQQFSVGWKFPQANEYHSETEEETEPPKPKRKFMLSGIKDKGPLEQVIVDLGGEVSMETTFDSSATHLLCGKPARNEKILGSIAAGKWILHHTYIKDCEIAGKFLDEEKYEWGNSQSGKELLSAMTTPTEHAIAAAAHRWRVKLSSEPGGAFEGMVALLIVADEKYESFERLIIAGGGTVILPRASYDPSSAENKITHCFIQARQKEQTIDWARMATKGILCFQPQFLHNVLTSEKPINPHECVLPDFRKYLALLPK